MEKLGWFCVLWVLVFSVHAGKVQRWVDENGQVHFGDAPPPAAVAADYQVKERSKGDAADLERLEREFGKDPFQVKDVVPGMQSHQVVTIMGRPDRTDYKSGGLEVWEYDKSDGVTTWVSLRSGYVLNVGEAPTYERHIYKGVDQSTGAPPQAQGAASQTPGRR